MEEIIIEHDCVSGNVIERALTPDEIAQMELDRAEAEANPPVMLMSEADRLREQLAALTARLEAERAAKEAEDAAKQAEREALSAWLLSRSDLTDGARAAILRALGSDVSTSRSIEGGTNG
jgi:hypothetical protein